MATKRVHNIAKELGVKSKAIVEKCQQEGISEDVVKNHMSVVGPGLEATIREWFAAAADSDEAESPHTAVETAGPVDVTKARAKKKTATKTADADESDSDSGSDTSTAVAEPTEAPEKAVEAPAPQVAAPAPPTQIATPTSPSAPTETGSPTAKPAAPALRPAASAPTTASNGSGAESPTASSDTASGTPTPSAKMNVPDRPKVVTPAGPQLEKKASVKLSGPKVVRVETPDRIDPPRPRRGPPGGGGGGGYGPMDMPPSDDGRGNRRRSGGTGVPARRRGRADTGAGTSSSGGGGGDGSWSQQDLAEREMRLRQSGGYLKQKRQQMRRQQGVGGEKTQTPAQRGGKVTIAEPFTIKDLSAATGVKAADIVKKLFMQHQIMVTINSGIEPEKAMEVMLDYDIELEVTEAKTAEQAVSEAFEDREEVDKRPRGPVVTILGHVDHGKTSLLDRIRNANVAQGEAGGITQATSAFRVPLEIGGEDRQVVFIDTPGHEAFTAMRARGANVTDIVVLVVAADDGVMPQTIESISHAKAAGAPIVVALNKIDKPEATDSNIQRILGQLAEHGLNPTDWGGETEVVRLSALKNQGIQDLLEILDLQAQVLELEADFGGPARGSVIESKPMEGRGSVANILVQEGELNVGDFIVMGRAFGRVRDITDDRGERRKTALPPMPVQISGIDALPDAGDKFYVVDSLKKAEQAAEQRRDKERQEQLAQPAMTLDRMFSQIAEKDLQEILVVLKADVQGSVDVLKHEIEKVSNDEIKVRVLHAAVGGVTESDVILAEASKAAIIGFNVIPSGKARRSAEAKGVEIRQYQVIYDIVEDIKKAAEGLLAPELRQEVLGHAEVRQVFKITKVGAIAGCYITDGTVERDALIRVTRNDIIIEDNRRLEQLKRFKDDVKEVRNGMECGMKIVGYDDIKEGDILECFKQVEVKRTL
ncbi:MAG: translation initiation factor IF-2 [Phycisphaerae bacterium]|nr:translation initiation factor IF-2 [Phycisphaerae bacterium]